MAGDRRALAGLRREDKWHGGRWAVLVRDYRVRMAKEDEICRTRSIKRQGPGAARAILLLLVIYSRPAASEVPDGTWLLANRVAIEVFDCSGLACGRIVWLLRPRTPDGQPDVDRRNPDAALRQRQLCGLTILLGTAIRRFRPLVQRLALRPARRQYLRRHRRAHRSRQDFGPHLPRHPALRPHRNPDPRSAAQLRWALLSATFKSSVSRTEGRYVTFAAFRPAAACVTVNKSTGRSDAFIAGSPCSEADKIARRHIARAHPNVRDIKAKALG